MPRIMGASSPAAASLETMIIESGYDCWARSRGSYLEPFLSIIQSPAAILEAVSSFYIVGDSESVLFPRLQNPTKGIPDQLTLQC